MRPLQYYENRTDDRLARQIDRQWNRNVVNEYTRAADSTADVNNYDVM